MKTKKKGKKKKQTSGKSGQNEEREKIKIEPQDLGEEDAFMEH